MTLSKEKQELYDVLCHMREVHRVCGNKGAYYSGHADFLLQNGKWYDLTPIPSDIRRGAPKSCYGNALLLGDSLNLRYIEGYATGVIPVQHAWNIDADGTLIDNTWMNGGLAYFGVEFSLGRAGYCTWFDDANVLTAKSSRVLYDKKWEGEDFSLVWQPVPVIGIAHHLREYGLL